jgi:hypothetical protein
MAQYAANSDMLKSSDKLVSDPMTQLNTTYYARCVTTLDRAFAALSVQAPDSVEYDIFRVAAKHSLIGLDEAERWMKYRDNRQQS